MLKNRLRGIVYFVFLHLILVPHTILNANSNYAIVFVHIGTEVPEYAEVALKQARLFNASCPIILIANQTAIDQQSLQNSLQSTDVTFVSCESLNKTSAHKQFVKSTKHNTGFREGFWRYTSERFLYLHDLMTQYHLENIFHLEYDNMLYADLSELLPVFEESYQGIGATFDNEKRCVPGFLYIKNQQSMSMLAKCFAEEAGRKKNDMQVIGIFKNKYSSDVIDYLPIAHMKYLSKYTLFGLSQFNLKNKYDFCKNIDKFDAIFDAAALGQYLGGIDPRNGKSKPGFINESCIFDPSKMIFQWACDKRGRWVPFATYLNEKRKIVNLHIHSKKLASFSSLEPQKQLVIMK